MCSRVGGRCPDCGRFPPFGCLGHGMWSTVLWLPGLHSCFFYASSIDTVLPIFIYTSETFQPLLTYLIRPETEENTFIPAKRLSSPTTILHQSKASPVSQHLLWVLKRPSWSTLPSCHWMVQATTQAPLKAVFVTHHRPDHFFGLFPSLRLFPPLSSMLHRMCPQTSTVSMTIWWNTGPQSLKRRMSQRPQETR